MNYISTEWSPPSRTMAVGSHMDLVERLTYLYVVLLRLENNGVELPIGDYGTLYGTLEDATEFLAQ